MRINSISIDLYADSGFGDQLKPGASYTQRLNVSPSTTTMEQLIEERVVPARTRVAATVRTGAQTPWLMATIVFKNASADKGTGAHGASQALASAPAVAAAPVSTGATAGPSQVLIPLSQRKRPHPVAGGIVALVGRDASGKLIRFYCLVAPSGRKIISTATANPFRWMPLVPAFKPPQASQKSSPPSGPSVPQATQKSSASSGPQTAQKSSAPSGPQAKQ